MPSDRSIVDQMLDRQRRVFRIAQDAQRYGLTLKLIAADAKLGYDSIRNYASGDTLMPISALYALVGVIPDELLSLLLPDGRQIVAIPEGLDHDVICELAQDYLTEKAKAHRPESEAGRDIGPNEDRTLCGKVAKLKLASG